MNLREQLIGSYQLDDWKIIEDGRLLDATLGPVDQCGGILIYSEDGYMSVWLSKKELVPFLHNAIDGGTDEEKLRTYNNFHGYTGRFSVDEEAGIITHYPMYGAFPNQLGKALTKKITVTGDLVRLDDTHMKFSGHGGQKKSSFVQWRKIHRKGE